MKLLGCKEIEVICPENFCKLVVKEKREWGSNWKRFGGQRKNG
jgi:hypothetical protein